MLCKKLNIVQSNEQGSAGVSFLQWRNFALFFTSYFALFKRGITNRHIDSHSLNQYLFIFDNNKFLDSSNECILTTFFDSALLIFERFMYDIVDRLHL